MKLSKSKPNLPSLLLRVGLAFVFLYAGIASLQQPLAWEGYVPHFISSVLGITTGLRVIAIGEIVLGMWLLVGKFAKYAAALSALMFAGIILVNLNELLITFRDVGLLFAALALYFIDA